MTAASIRFGNRAIAVAAIAALGVGLLAGLAPTTGGASSHREAPLISGDPQVDNTDLYAFVDPTDHGLVNLISSWIPLEEPAGGPNFYPWEAGAYYDINIDNDGNAKADIIYRWIFKDHRRDGGGSFLYANGQVTGLRDANLLFYQTYDLYRISVRTGRDSSRVVVNNAVSVPSNVGAATMPDFPSLSDDGVVGYGGNSQTWAGQSDDPFFLDLRVFDLLYGGNLTEVGDDTLAGFNVNTMALQVPADDLAAGRDAEANPIIGIWNTASRKILGGGYGQVSRLGMPLVNEVVIPYKDKDKFNASKPKGDGQFLNYVTKPELPALIEAVYGIPAPDTPRDDLVAVFLTGVTDLNQPAGVTGSEQLRLNMSINADNEGCATSSRLGVIGGDICGFPNGRRLEDDVIDIALRVVEGVLLETHDVFADNASDGVDDNPEDFLDEFPYVQYANSGSDPTPH